eukprot:4744731-Prymnesium_polylepis.1
MTPTILHSPSPIERDIARPTRPLFHTRLGRPLRPEGVTVPPILRMRACSPGRSGLWSWLISVATTFFPLRDACGAPRCAWARFRRVTWAGLWAHDIAGISPPPVCEPLSRRASAEGAPPPHLDRARVSRAGDPDV